MPVRHAVRILTALDAAMYRVIGQESAEVMLGAGETSRTRVRRTHPAEGLNTELGWKRAKSNKGAPGVDDISIKEFPDIILEKWESIREFLMEGTYEPSPVLRVEIPKSTEGTWPLGIQTVLDRLIRQAIARVLTPIFDPEFSDFSFGFRPGRSAHDAVFKPK